MEYQKLFRSRTNKAIAGVAGGLGEFFLIDPVIIRIIFVILAVMGGGGVLIYVLLWIFVPYKFEETFTSANTSANNYSQQKKKESEIKDTEINTENPYDNSKHHNSKGPIFGGVILITLGILFLASEIIPEVNFDKLWPVILIVIGLLLLGSSFRKNNKN